MVWNNLVALFTFITFATTSSTDFGVLVYVVGTLNPSTNDPSSYTILLLSSNSNGNPFTDSGLLGGTYSFAGLNSSKACCVTTLFVYSSVVYKPSCVYCCCCYKCCCKCCKCFRLVMVSIQSSHTSPSKCRCSSPSRNLMSCSFLIPWFCSLNCLSFVVMSYVVSLASTPSAISLVEMSSVVLQ